MFRNITKTTDFMVLCLKNQKNKYQINNKNNSSIRLMLTQNNRFKGIDSSTGAMKGQD